ncbi:membrane oxidoreductase [Streptomyces triticagri]|uniref:Membrane oxidoreductase n=1 Tax=Streptomyces triticagri TaxID=2293568 RepID=A0A372LVN5_9ACTN|nr:SRPBCC family protein [Streptomyces triticagri]RFU82599.1 membrane oxidoreductase [Streptomyces triticagri]
MKIDNEFRVDVPVERAWEALTDLEALAPCMPGAQLTGVEGEVHRGKVKVKVGPVISQFAGTAQFVERDRETHSAVISAAGKDTRGQGNASARINAVLRPDGPERTQVSVTTDLNISGKLAQFGSGMIKEISEKLFAQFVANVESQLLAGPAETGNPAPEASPEPEGRRAAAAASAPDSPSAVDRAGASVTAKVKADDDQEQGQGQEQEPEKQSEKKSEPEDGPEALDLMRLAGKSVYKRLIPVAVAAVVVGVVIYLLVR